MEELWVGRKKEEESGKLNLEAECVCVEKEKKNIGKQRRGECGLAPEKADGIP